MEIDEILDKLIGHTDITCETNYDNESNKNLDLLKKVILWATNRLVENSKWYGDYRASANYLADKSLNIIEEANEQLEYAIAIKDNKFKEVEESDLPF